MNIKEMIRSGEPEHEARWDYPLDAIREIVINMIIHRDYRSSSNSIIKIFPDRIEFYNPGKEKKLKRIGPDRGGYWEVVE